MKRRRVLLLQKNEVDFKSQVSEFEIFWKNLIQDRYELYMTLLSDDESMTNPYLKIRVIQYSPRADGGLWLDVGSVWTDEFDILICDENDPNLKTTPAFVHQKRVLLSEAKEFFKKY